MTDTSSPQKFPAQARWREANPIATWAHSATRSAIRRGILKPPPTCEQCGRVGPVDAHHDDHASPLDVRFWCRSCHRQHHARLRKAGAS